MGANGSKAKGTTETEEGRRWKTAETLSNGVKIIEFKDPKTPGKMPEESHSHNSIYAMMNKNGGGIKSIAVYDENCLKVVEIHTTDHDGLGMHYHDWKGGKPISNHPISDNPKWEKLLSETLESL